MTIEHSNERDNEYPLGFSMTRLDSWKRRQECVDQCFGGYISLDAENAGNDLLKQVEKMGLGDVLIIKRTKIVPSSKQNE